VNDPIERRLGDLFDAIDRQVELPDLRERIERRSVRLRWTMAAAVIAVVAAAAFVVAARRDQAAELRPAASPASTVDVLTFNRLAGDLCVTLERERNGVVPRFATPDAYLVVAGQRRDVISAFLGELVRIAGPVDDPGLPGEVAQALRIARQSLDEVERAAIAGRLDEAAEYWARVDPEIDAALAPLRAHGAQSC
jgi:hypothetical protein